MSYMSYMSYMSRLICGSPLCFSSFMSIRWKLWMNDRVQRTFALTYVKKTYQMYTAKLGHKYTQGF